MFGRARHFCGSVCFLLMILAPLAAFGAIQFDVFLGYGGQSTGSDGIVREGAWFPMVCEVFNDGPGFQANLELSSGQMRASQVRRMSFDLPTNTRKRVVMPVFASGGRYSTWDVRLMDSSGRAVAERKGLRPRDLAWESRLLGALPRSFSGLPDFPAIKPNRVELQPQVARFQVETFPDNPIALEGMDSFYLSSQSALALRGPQVDALRSWVRTGGRLIVGAESMVELRGLPWLNSLLPLDVTGSADVNPGASFQTWLTGTRVGALPNFQPPPQAPRKPRPNNPFMQNQPTSQSVPGRDPFKDLLDDLPFSSSTLQVVTGTLKDGRALITTGGKPLVISGKRGRGEVILLTFSPEREPFKSWKHKSWFWAKLVGVPQDWFSITDYNAYGGFSSDGVFGGMIDSRQVRKLPVEWLLALLVVYLLVIGPVDQFLLKKNGKQMWTWVTFPIYVIVASCSIYFVGYKLRAGVTEWNEIHIADILPMGEKAEIRGRTVASVYSPSNAEYPMAGDQTFATLRSEFQGLWGGASESSRAVVVQNGNAFQAQISVPVWTSQLFVSDWLQRGTAPMDGRVTSQGPNLSLEVTNHLNRRLTEVRVAVRGRVYQIGEIGALASTNIPLDFQRSQALQDFAEQGSRQFQGALQRRQQTIGETTGSYIDNPPQSTTVISFLSLLNGQNNAQRNFIYPSGLDVMPTLERDGAVLFAWDAANGAVTTPRKFQVARSQANTLWRLFMPVD